MKQLIKIVQRMYNKQRETFKHYCFKNIGGKFLNQRLRFVFSSITRIPCKFKLFQQVFASVICLQSCLHPTKFEISTGIVSQVAL